MQIFSNINLKVVSREPNCKGSQVMTSPLSIWHTTKGKHNLCYCLVDRKGPEGVHCLVHIHWLQFVLFALLHVNFHMWIFHIRQTSDGRFSTCYCSHVIYTLQSDVLVPSVHCCVPQWCPPASMPASEPLDVS